MSSSQLRGRFGFCSPRGYFVVSGAILGCHNSRSQGGYCPVGVEARDGTEHSLRSRTALHNKELPDPKCQC